MTATLLGGLLIRQTCGWGRLGFEGVLLLASYAAMTVILALQPPHSLGLARSRRPQCPRLGRPLYASGRPSVSWWQCQRCHGCCCHHTDACHRGGILLLLTAANSGPWLAGESPVQPRHTIPTDKGGTRNKVLSTTKKVKVDTTEEKEELERLARLHLSAAPPRLSTGAHPADSKLKAVRSGSSTPPTGRGPRDGAGRRGPRPARSRLGLRRAGQRASRLNTPSPRSGW